MSLSLKEARALYTRLAAEWVVWAYAEALHAGELLAMGEQLVAITDARDGDHDGPHKKGGAHYMGTGGDWVLWRNGVYITDGSDPRWLQLGEKWESMHELARWGGRFRDANHISIEHGGMK
jgi:hypothetical protein